MFIKVKDWENKTHVLQKAHIVLVTDAVDSAVISNDIKKKAKSMLLIAKDQKHVIDLYSKESIDEIFSKLESDKNNDKKSTKSNTTNSK